MSQNDAASKRGTRDIESSMENTRLRIDHKLEMLEERLKPSAMINHGWRYACAKSEDGTTSRLRETVAHNPLPVVLIGVGFAWLLLSGRAGSVPRPESPLVEGAEGESRPGEEATTRSGATPSSDALHVGKKATNRPESARRSGELRPGHEATNRSATNRPSSEAAAARDGTTARGSTDFDSDEKSSQRHHDSQRHDEKTTRHDSSSASTNESAKTTSATTRTSGS